MTVHVLIPVHNRVNTTMECLDCLYAQDFGDFRVVVVDDGSTDGTSERIKEKYPQAEILAGDGSLWWTGAMRFGVEHILKTAGHDDFVLALNDDVSFDTDFVTGIVNTSVENRRAVTGSLCRTEGYGHFTADGAFVKWGYLNTVYSIPVYYREDQVPEIVRDMTFLWGHGLLIPVEVFHKVGNFNSRDLPHYGGDTEFTYRAGKAGFSLVVSTGSVLVVKQDKEHTGVHFSDKWYLPLRQAWNIVFSIKSPGQIKTSFKLLDAYCPRKYRFMNKARVLLQLAWHIFIRTLPVAVPRLVVKYLFNPFPVPAGEFSKIGMEIDKLAEKDLVRKKILNGREYYYFTVPYESICALGDEGLASLYNSSCSFKKKLEWFRDIIG